MHVKGQTFVQKFNVGPTCAGFVSCENPFEKAMANLILKKVRIKIVSK